MLICFNSSLNEPILYRVHLIDDVSVARKYIGTGCASCTPKVKSAQMH